MTPAKKALKMYLPEKSFSAKTVAEAPEMLHDYFGYVLLTDRSSDDSHHNVVRALNAMDPSWQIVQMSASGGDTWHYLYVLLYRERLKRSMDEDAAE